MKIVGACTWMISLFFMHTAWANTSEKLVMEIPENWVKVIDRKAGNLHIAEYYPPDTGEEWTQKLTIEALLADDLPDPLVFAQGLATEQERVCNDFSDNGVFAGFENGYPTTVHMMQCGASQRTGRALLTMIKVIQGNQALYTITRIWRFPPKPAEQDQRSEKPIDQAELGAWSAVLRKILACDPALPAHPCPN